MRVQYSESHVITNFCDAHDIGVNQKYAGIHPYSFHLEQTAKFARKYRDLLPSELLKLSEVVAYGHDILEDTHLTYNDVKTIVSSAFRKPEDTHNIVEAIFHCTEYRGRNREERKPVEFYQELVTDELAVFTKLCDMMANVTYGLATNSSMPYKYKQEFTDKFIRYSYLEKFKSMYDYLDSLFQTLTKN